MTTEAKIVLAQTRLPTGTTERLHREGGSVGLIVVTVRRERCWTPAGATQALKVSIAIGFETGKAALALNP